MRASDELLVVSDLISALNILLISSQLLNKCPEKVIKRAIPLFKLSTLHSPLSTNLCS